MQFKICFSTKTGTFQNFLTQTAVSYVADCQEWRKNVPQQKLLGGSTEVLRITLVTHSVASNRQ